MFHRLAKPPVLVACLALATTASAALTAAALDAAIAPRADVSEGATENDAGIRGMNEAQTISVTATPDFGVSVTAGVDYIDCHLLHFDPVNDPQTRTGRFKFDGEIIGVITETDTLFDWDELCDPGAPMAYPAITEVHRGLEPAQTPDDEVRVGQSASGAWNRIEVTAEVSGHTDQVRVITCRDTAPGSCHDLADSIGWDTLVMP